MCRFAYARTARGGGNLKLAPQGFQDVCHSEGVYPKESSLLLIPKAGLLRHKPRNDKFGFTLAEVLITLGIIGVVAAMTLPVLIANFKEKEIIAKAKKDYSIVMQALQLAQNDYGTPNDNSSLFLSGETNNEVMTNFSKYVKGGQLCLTNSKEDICTSLKYQILLSTYKGKYNPVAPPAIILPDNSVLFLVLSTNKCTDTVNSGIMNDEDGNFQYNPDGTPVTWTQIRNDCGAITFDVNGAKGPNKYGYDAFRIDIWPDHVGKSYWDVYGASSLFSILSGGKLKYNQNN